MEDVKTKTEYQKINLTDRRPVRIKDDIWPVIADGTWYHYDSEFECQANRTWLLRIRVRKHEDGRFIVYGIYEYNTDFQHESCFSAQVGVMCSPADDIVHNIKIVGDLLLKRFSDARQNAEEGLWHLQAVVSEAISELEPEEV